MSSQSPRGSTEGGATREVETDDDDSIDAADHARDAELALHLAEVPGGPLHHLGWHGDKVGAARDELEAKERAHGGTLGVGVKEQLGVEVGQLDGIPHVLDGVLGCLVRGPFASCSGGGVVEDGGGAGMHGSVPHSRNGEEASPWQARTSFMMRANASAGTALASSMMEWWKPSSSSLAKTATASTGTSAA